VAAGVADLTPYSTRNSAKKLGQADFAALPETY